MKSKSSLCAGLAAVCLCFAVLVPAARAQAPDSPAATPALPGPPTVTGPSKVAIINIQTAITSTAEGKKLASDLSARFAPRTAEIQSEQKALAALNKQLADGGNTMSQEAKAQLNQQITTKQRDYQQTAQNAQSDFQNAQTDLMNQVGNKMMPILKTYAEQHGYTAVIDVSLPWPQSPVLYFNPGTEITGDIVKLYDEAHPLTPAAAKGGN